MNIALEIRERGDLSSLLDHAFCTARAHRAPLVEGKRAEITAAKATSVVRDRKLDLLDPRNAAKLLVGRVKITHIGERIDAVKLLALQGGHGRILHQHLVVVDLADRATVDRILIFVLYTERFGVLALVFLEVVVIKGCGNLKMDGFFGL